MIDIGFRVKFKRDEVSDQVAAKINTFIKYREKFLSKTT